MKNTTPLRIKSVTEFHQFRGLSKPQHPLISVINYADIKQHVGKDQMSWLMDYYSISIKRTTNINLKYGQQPYDFDEGIMFFMAPGQILTVTTDTSIEPKHTGWMLLFHPDFLWITSLAKTIRQYEFFDYSVNEALFVSEKEELIIANIIKNIEQEYHANMDKYSQSIIISLIESLLNYSERFYNRQFITRKISNHQILEKLETLLDDYFENEDEMKAGLPNVQYFADQLNVSVKYLGSLLKQLTGQSTQHHIHEKLIEKAKQKLSTTDLSVSEIAYDLGFEHSQSFSKLFKIKTNFTPLEFRHSFN